MINLITDFNFIINELFLMIFSTLEYILKINKYFSMSTVIKGKLKILTEFNQLM